MEKRKDPLEQAINKTLKVYLKEFHAATGPRETWRSFADLLDAAQLKLRLFCADPPSQALKERIRNRLTEIETLSGTSAEFSRSEDRFDLYTLPKSRR